MTVITFLMLVKSDAQTNIYKINNTLRKGLWEVEILRKQDSGERVSNRGTEFIIQETLITGCVCECECVLHHWRVSLRWTRVWCDSITQPHR